MDTKGETRPKRKKKGPGNQKERENSLLSCRFSGIFRKNSLDVDGRHNAEDAEDEKRPHFESLSGGGCFVYFFVVRIFLFSELFLELPVGLRDRGKEQSTLVMNMDKKLTSLKSC